MQIKRNERVSSGFSLIEMIIGMSCLILVVGLAAKFLNNIKKEYAAMSVKSEVFKDADRAVNVLKYINARKPADGFAGINQDDYVTAGDFLVSSSASSGLGSYTVRFETKCREFPDYVNLSPERVTAYTKNIEERTKDRLGKCYIKNDCQEDEFPYISIESDSLSPKALKDILPRVANHRKSATILSAVGCLRRYPQKMVHVIIEGFLQVPKSKGGTTIRTWSREVYLPEKSISNLQNL